MSKKLNPSQNTTPIIRKSPRLNPNYQNLSLHPKVPDSSKPFQIFPDLSEEKKPKKNENLGFLRKKNYGFLRSGVEKSEICVRTSPRLAVKKNIIEKKESKLSKIGRMEIEKEKKRGINKRVTRSSGCENSDEIFKKNAVFNKAGEKVVKKRVKNSKYCEKGLFELNSGDNNSGVEKRVTRSSYKKECNLERSLFGAKSCNGNIEGPLVVKHLNVVGKSVIKDGMDVKDEVFCKSVFEKRVTRSSNHNNDGKNLLGVERSLFGAKSCDDHNVGEPLAVKKDVGGKSVVEKMVTRSSSRKNDGKNLLDAERNLFGAKSSDRSVEGPLVVKRIDVGGNSRSCEGRSVVNGKMDVKEGGFGKSLKVTGVKRKRNEVEEGNSNGNGWTKNQEVALQKAYFAAKPTPNFWKRVAKLVPGKSAHDCFIKGYADDLTPPKPKTRLRTTKRDVSSFSLSPSKVLKPEVSKPGKITKRKQKGHLAQKAVRQLLQKHVSVDQSHEADLFSVLEPGVDLPTNSLKCGVSYSTPQREKGSIGFLCDDKSSSGLKKRFSRLSSSKGKSLVSPPVLKPVRNKVLHEKYIDQLHCREAKRKVACGKENKKKAVNQKMETIDVLKDALVMDAKDIIHKLQDKKDKATREYSDDDDENKCLEEYDEDDEF